MKKTIIAILLCAITLAIDIEGEGKFLAHDDDSISFIKKQLLSNAFKKIINTELKLMGLDYSTFWNNYNSKFEEHFLVIKESIEAKYQVEEGKELSAKRTERLNRELRRKRLISKAKFGRLDRSISKYSIKKLSRSMRMPNSHYINVSAKVNKKKLTDIYYKFIGVSQYRSLKKLYVDVSYNLIHTNWLELGVQTEGDFVSVVNGHWKEKLEDNLEGVFLDGVELVTDSNRTRIEKRLKHPLGSLSQISSPFFKSDDSDLIDSLYLKIDVSMEKENTGEELKSLALIFSGGLILTDLKDNSVVTYFDFIKEKSNFNTLDQLKLSTNIASLVYRLPMLTIQSIRKTVEENGRLKNTFELTLKGTNTIDEAFAFLKLLSEKGVLYYFNPSVTSLSGNEVKINVSYFGSREKALRVLASLVSMKVSTNRKIIKNGELPFVFNIIDIEIKSGEVNRSSSVNGERG